MTELSIVMLIEPQDILPGLYVRLVKPCYGFPSGTWLRVVTPATRDGYATVEHGDRLYRLDVAWTCQPLSNLEQLAAAGQG